jgi:hypothetical protein
MASRGNKVGDSGQRGEAKTGAWSRGSTASNREKEVRLERTHVEVASGRRPIHRSFADKTRQRGQGGAPGRGRKVGGEREELGLPWASNRCGDARRRAELRRQISSSSVRLE